MMEVDGVLAYWRIRTRIKVNKPGEAKRSEDARLRLRTVPVNAGEWGWERWDGCNFEYVYRIVPSQKYIF